MRLLINPIFFILLALLSQLTHASGQRTTKVSLDAIKSYKELTFSNDSTPEPVLHYVGTVNNNWHLLMITKTSFPARNKSNLIKSRPTGMPWDHVFTYKVSSNTMTIINGWDISDKIKLDGIKIRPSYCPKLQISDRNKKYRISEDKKIQLKCLNMNNN